MALTEIIGGASTLIGALGTIFGGQKTDMPPELRELFDMLELQAEQGLSPEEEFALQRRLDARLSSEAGALGAATESRLTRAGAGTGVIQSALAELNTSRLGALGQGLTDISLMNEQAKRNAVSQIAGLAPTIGQFTRDTSAGFQQLLGFGLNTLLEPGRQKRQADILEQIQGTRAE